MARLWFMRIIKVQSTKNKKRLVYFDYFRAIAILLIVLSHCYNTWHPDKPWESMVANIISGNTALFVFISGFFFHEVYFPKYHYQTFLKHKTLVVLLPYLILSSLFLFIYYLITSEIVMAKHLNDYFGKQLSNLTLITANLATGRTMWAYWYIPFAMMLFALSPIFIKFIGLKLSTKLQITAALFICSVFIQRSLMSINPFHSLLYFVPYYLLGIIYSMHRARINGLIEGKGPILLLITTMTALGMHFLGQNHNAAKASILAWHGADYMIFQKLTLILFMLAFTMQLQQYNIPALKMVANMSFAIFFLHQWVLETFYSIGINEVEHGFDGAMLLFICVASLSYLAARLIKKALKDKSRFVIGW